MERGRGPGEGQRIRVVEERGRRPGEEQRMRGERGRGIGDGKGQRDRRGPDQTMRGEGRGAEY